MIVETAPAKVNLYLHVGPIRSDGLHELASLFVFAARGDKIRVTPSTNISISITGPYSAALAGMPREQNLVWRAASLLKSAAGVETGATITLEKNLPVAAGVGGGSADAAAALRALVKLWRIDIAKDALLKLAFNIGADVPACLACAPIEVTGAGERIAPGPTLPPLWICLANPGVEMPTGPVFAAFDKARQTPALPETISLNIDNYETLATSLARTRNDLEPFACALAPTIKDVITALAAAPGALVARMSGSGATVFALFASAGEAETAEAHMRTRGWWALAAPICRS